MPDLGSEGLKRLKAGEKVSGVLSDFQINEKGELQVTLPPSSPLSANGPDAAYKEQCKNLAYSLGAKTVRFQGQNWSTTTLVPRRR